MATALNPYFPEFAQLNNQLKIGHAELDGQNTRLRRADNADIILLPGRPCISLHSPNLFSDPRLLKEFMTPALNRLSPHLWLVATQSSSHIAPLHLQVARGRAIIVTENPELHLVWEKRRVFVKPLPRFLLSHAFWVLLLQSCQKKEGIKYESVLKNEPGYEDRDNKKDSLLPTILGYMRTWSYLIQHESDLSLAQTSGLLPSDCKNITLDQFHAFISGFGSVDDDAVSARYASYGDLRLSRLNLWSKVFLRESEFFKTHWQYADYFAMVYAPIFFVFGAATAILSAMQVALAALPGSEGLSGISTPWISFQIVSLWFSVIILVCVALILVGLISAFSFLVLREASFATRALFRRHSRSMLV